MSRGKELTKNTIIVSIGRICTQCISFFLLPLYTAKLTTEEYGTVDLLNTYVLLLIPIIIFEIQQAIFRYLIDARKDEQEKIKIISSALIIAIIQSGIYLIIYAIIGKFINNNYKYFLATNVIATIFSSIMLQIARGFGDNKNYAIGSFITASFTIIFNVIFIAGFNLGAYGMLTASLISNVFCALYIIIKLKLYRYIKLKEFNFKKVKEMWKYSIPLIPNAISWWIMSASDRTIITTFLGVGQNGIYSAANKFSSIYSTFTNIFSITWTETVSTHINDKDSAEYFSKLINIVFNIFTTISLGIISLVPFVFNIFINENFNEAFYQIPILMFGTLANTMVILISGLYIAKKMTKQVARTSIVAAIINIILDIILIKYIGLYAASISTFVAYLSMMIYRMLDIKKYINIKFDIAQILKSFFIGIIIVILYYINNLWLNIISLVIVVLYGLYINKEVIKNLKNEGFSFVKKILKH